MKRVLEARTRAAASLRSQTSQTSVIDRFSSALIQNSSESEVRRFKLGLRLNKTQVTT